MDLEPETDRIIYILHWLRKKKRLETKMQGGGERERGMCTWYTEKIKMS